MLRSVCANARGYWSGVWYREGGLMQIGGGGLSEGLIR